MSGLFITLGGGVDFAPTEWFPPPPTFKIKSRICPPPNLSSASAPVHTNIPQNQGQQKYLQYRRIVGLGGFFPFTDEG